MIRSSEYDKLELKHQNLVFKNLLLSWCETEMQKYAIGETECNEI